MLIQTCGLDSTSVEWLLSMTPCLDSWCAAAARSVASMATRRIFPPRGNTGLTLGPEQILLDTS